MKWIPLEEKKPAIREHVLVYHPDEGIFVGEYQEDNEFFVVMTKSDPVWLRLATHWIPLPKQPSEK